MTPPEIHEVGPEPDQVHGGFPDLYAVVTDDRFGSGIDPAASYMVVNGVMIQPSYDPTSSRLFYQVSADGPFEPGSFEISFVVFDYAGNETRTDYTVSLTLVGIEDDGELPYSYFLGQNYPNPFDRETEIQYELAAPGRVRINLYDIQGRFVSTLYAHYESEGRHVVRFSPGKSLASGVYFYQLKAGDFNAVRPLVLAR
jgi:hypothetical protein